MAKFAKSARRVMKHAGLRSRQAMLTHSPGWLKRTLGPVASYFDMLFIDHGVFRLVYLNRYPLPGTDVWRSAQPAPHQIGHMARKGIRTAHGAHRRAALACASAGAAQRAGSRSLPGTCHTESE